jgi:dienelactone hydrolase
VTLSLARRPHARRKLWLVPVLVTTLGIAGLGPSGAAAAQPKFTPLDHCGTYAGLEICSGEVASFDGTLLDADLTLPPAGTGQRHPLIVLLHGFGNDKHEWESTTDDADGGDKWHWNSHWFATHGYYVLTYTARGFQSQPGRAYEPDTQVGTSRLTSPSATIHLKSREFEARDTQWLSALAAASLPHLDRRRIAVSGGSYGGGESWLLASQAEWTFPHSVLPALPVLSLQVAVPKYPWTDLAYSLLPNGHGDPYTSAQVGNPIGVDKLSYTNALFAIGNSTGMFEAGTTTTPSTEGPINLLSWFSRIVDVGEPYETPSGQDADSIVTQVRRGLTVFRGSYYQSADWQRQVGRREVAVFSISGWTDDLFPPVESFRQFKELKRLDPLWPVQVGVADVGHPRAQNAGPVWQTLNAQAWEFLSGQIAGSHRQQTSVFSLPTQCAPRSEPASGRVTASTPEALARGHLTVDYSASQVLTSDSGLADPNGPATDPLVHATSLESTQAPCITSPGPAVGGFTGLSSALPRSSTYVGPGYVEVQYVFTGQSGQLDARLWDVAPSGETLLVSHGAYRLDVAGFDTPTGTLRVPFSGNHWQFAAGHRLRLDLTQVDQPFLRPSNLPSSVAFTNPRLVLPTHEASETTLTGT